MPAMARGGDGAQSDPVEADLRRVTLLALVDALHALDWLPSAPG